MCAGHILIFVEVFFDRVEGDGEVVIAVLSEYGHYLWSQDIEGECGFGS